MRYSGGRHAWPLWVVSEGGRDIALAAAPNAVEAIAVSGTSSVEVEAKRIGTADDGCVRVVRRLWTVPMDRPSDPMGRRMLERSATAVGISLAVALESNSALAVTARWATWYVMSEQRVTLKEAGRQLGGRDHSTVRNAVMRTPAKLSAGDVLLKAAIEAARSVLC